jgi:hypothetical protein
LADRETLIDRDAGKVVAAGCFAVRHLAEYHQGAEVEADRGSGADGGLKAKAELIA